MNKIFYGLILSCLIIKADVNQDDSLGVFKNYHNFSELDKSFLADFGIQEVPDYSNEYYHIDFFKKFVDEENVQGEDKELILKKIKDAKVLVRTKSYNEMSQEEKDEFDKTFKEIETKANEILEKYPNESAFKIKENEINRDLYSLNIDLSRAKTEEERKKIRDEIANNKKLIAKRELEKELIKRFCREEGIKEVYSFEAFQELMSKNRCVVLLFRYKTIFMYKVSLKNDFKEESDQKIKLIGTIKILEDTIEYAHKLLKEFCEKEEINAENIKNFDQFEVELIKLYKEGEEFQDLIIKKYFALYEKSIELFENNLKKTDSCKEFKQEPNSEIEDLKKKIEDLKNKYKTNKTEALKELFEEEGSEFDDNKSFEDFKNVLRASGNETLIYKYELLFKYKINLKIITTTMKELMTVKWFESSKNQATKKIEDLTKEIKESKKEQLKKKLARWVR